MAEIYTELLAAALTEREGSELPLSATEALAQVVTCRRNAVRSGVTPIRRGWATVALADQVAYDSALIRYAGIAGVSCDSRRFGSPARRAAAGRARADGKRDPARPVTRTDDGPAPAGPGGWWSGPEAFVAASPGRPLGDPGRVAGRLGAPLHPDLASMLET